MKQSLIELIPTIEVRSEVAVVSFHQLLNCRLKLRVVPFSPVVTRVHTTTDNNTKRWNMVNKSESQETACLIDIITNVSMFFFNPVQEVFNLSFSHPCVKLRQRVSSVCSWRDIVDQQAELGET